MALMMIGLLDLELGSLNSLGPCENKTKEGKKERIEKQLIELMTNPLEEYIYTQST